MARLETVASMVSFGRSAEAPSSDLHGHCLVEGGRGGVVWIDGGRNELDMLRVVDARPKNYERLGKDV